VYLWALHARSTDVNASLKFPISGPISPERRSQTPHLSLRSGLRGGGHGEDAGTLFVLEPITLTADADRGRVMEEVVDDGRGGNLVTETHGCFGVASAALPRWLRASEAEGALPPHWASTNRRRRDLDLPGGRVATGTRAPSLYSFLRAANTMLDRR